MDFHIISIHIFEFKDSIADIPIELSCLSDLENPGQLLVQEVLNFFTLHVYEIDESIADTSTELYIPCMVDLENLWNRKSFCIFEVPQK